MPYIGTSPSNGVRRVHTYTATASQTTFTGASSEGVTLSYADTNYLDVFQNGVLLGSADYTSTSGTSVVLAQGASADDLIVIVVYDVFSVADTVSKTNGGSFDSGVTMSSTLGVTGATTLTGGVSGNTTFTGDIGVGDDVNLTSDSSKLTFGADSEIQIEHAHNEGLKLQGSGTNTQLSLLSFHSTNGTIPDLRLGKSGSDTIGTFAETADGESIAQIRFTGVDTGGNSRSAGQITVIQEGSSTGSSVPANMRFNTSGSEAMRINSSQEIIFRKTSTSDAVEGTVISNRINQTTDNGICMLINRHSSDGTLVLFRNANVTEGQIDISGTTVSYNGGHLSRYSQLTNNTRDNTIVKGTVMTNLDQMAEWTTDGVTEDNEQLNCMAVSSVEGDPNVSGLFVRWDDDDEVYTNDMTVAMTGDMVVRIAQGTTVARGDLLMSAGDGTAKPQGDDIVRSKTIAKVTSTNVSHTYDDGTYLVPCVVMAC